ncbi:MAG: bifunctional DNA-formamidopyrimidine glycosylase/DNA-(apurinic or apyrimidinic site) lyase [Kineosporiaceae bacterium]
MPELPEVESVRRGLADLVTGRRVVRVSVRHPRLLRDQPGGAGELTARLTGRVLASPRRRGKFLWLPLADPGQPAAVAGAPGAGVPGVGPAAEALVVHLGMSGQVRLTRPHEAVHPHTRVVLDLDDDRQLRVVDQRMFGRLRVDDLVADPAAPGGAVPAHARHIAADPLEPAFDARAFVRRLAARRTTVKRALLDQTLVSGIGNIYADESLWRARIHGERPTLDLPGATGRRLLAHVTAVLTEAVAAGGTSFDALYVDVNGASGEHGEALAVYGRAGRACPRCGTPVARAAFANRSSFWCPRCQRPPRPAAPTLPTVSRLVTPAGGG